jgi:WW domain-binding protein 4
MGKKAEAEKSEAAQTAEALGVIEERAAKQYAADLAAAAAANGTWAWDAGAGYYYNERHAYYWDPKSRAYYGGGDGPVATTFVRRVIQLPAHPQAGVGGYQMPQGGRIGASKGVGAAGGGAAAGGKRPRDEPAKKVSKEDAEALARREAAKQRVQQRALSNFGMG